MLYLNQFDDTEAEIIAFLICEEKYSNIFSIDDTDYRIEWLFDDKVFDKYMEIANYQAEHSILINCADRIKDTKREAKTLLNYRFNLQEESNRYKLLNRELKRKVRILRQSLHRNF